MLISQPHCLAEVPTELSFLQSYQANFMTGQRARAHCPHPALSNSGVSVFSTGKDMCVVGTGGGRTGGGRQEPNPALHF